MDLTSCTLCPRRCKVNRSKGEIGFCGAGNKIKICNFSLYFFEEPPISGTNGSGAVFFSCCPLKCLYCQNYVISTQNQGIEIEIEDLTSIFLNLQEHGAHNINLVTPTHYLPWIVTALKKAKEKGLTIPIVYNCSGYESVEALRELDGLIDIYLPDFKYYEDELGKCYSKVDHYREKATEALLEMYRQVGDITLKDGLMKRGMIVRHMMLPEELEDSKKILKKLYQMFGNHICYSIMNQYTPLPFVKDIPSLNKTVREEDYQALIDYALDIGIENAYMQEDGTQKESFIPLFDKEVLLEQLKKTTC